MKPTSLLLTLLFSSIGSFLSANNISVSNTTTTGQDVSAGTDNPANFTLVQFDLSWDNSWRTSNGPANWDAAWVFVKFQVGVINPVFTGVSSSGTTITVSSTANLRVGMPIRVSSGTGAFAANTVISSITNATQFVVSATPSTALNNATIECIRIWEHASLNTNAGNHTAAAGSTIDVPSDGKGVFIYRSTNGSGTNNFSGTQLRWQYGADGVLDDAVIQVQVFAIEMVYVPGGVDFNVGGGGGTSAFTSTTINTAVANTVPAGSGSLGGQAGGYPTGQTAPNANWPNGYNAFYCMKYEISQGQYRDFLNTLTYTQQNNRTVSSPDDVAGTGALSSTNAFRNSIAIQTPGNASSLAPAIYGCNLNGNTVFNEATDGEWIACNFLTWMDGCAFVDWAGLRPMTELEFEKACRGDLAAVSGEYAWGSSIIKGFIELLGGGANNETSSISGANSNLLVVNTQGPMRVGAFAKAGTNREQSGATYYGVMEMSGNLWERAVSMGNDDGRVFTGIHGDGVLSSNGHANSSLWPGLLGTELSDATGSGYRGGGADMTMSSQIFATGGTVTDIVHNDLLYRVHTFDTVGTSNFTVLVPALNVDYLVVGGGGGGASRQGSGGGGAGGVLHGSMSVIQGVIPVEVGAGGIGGLGNTSPYSGTRGGNSVFSSFIANGGGGGRMLNNDQQNGGSGGGGGRSTNAPGTGILGQGNNGGSGASNVGGGGGGAGSAGQAGIASTSNGSGGAGVSNSITGTDIIYAGGGGAGGDGSRAGGLGGTGGGGNGGSFGASGQNGTNGLGGGGGGGAGSSNLIVGGNGGSGIVIVRYTLPTPDPTPLQVSDRSRATLTETAPKNNEGFRGVRSAQ